MADVPETRYVRSGDVHIAYQQIGDGGPHSFLGVPPIVSNIEVIWENPAAARFLHRLARLGRYIHFDKRGQGLSDRDIDVPTIDQRVDDLLAVLDAVGVERAVVGGISEGGSTAAMFAATHPDRVSHLVLYGTFASLTPEAGHLPTTTPETIEAFFDAWVRSWGTAQSLSMSAVCPIGVESGQATVEWISRFERQSTSPGGLRESSQWIRRIDITELLPAIHAPTLVLHSHDDRMVPITAGRFLAENIPGATLVELHGVDHLPWFGDQEQVLSEIEEFVTGRSSLPDPDRVLATVLFTDIVESTKRAAAVGDRAWRDLLEDHDAVVSREVQNAGGRVIKSTGDGSLATFDRPGRALDAAASVRKAIKRLGLAIRVGVHTGEVELRGEDVGGIAVHLAARVCAAAASDEVLVSRTVTDLVVGSGHLFIDRGDHELKGVPGRWKLFALTTAAA